jgi:hypothetical protein
VNKRQDLKEKYASAAELRTKKVVEIGELLAIPPHPGDEEAVKFIAQWRETGGIRSDTTKDQGAAPAP